MSISRCTSRPVWVGLMVTSSSRKRVLPLASSCMSVKTRALESPTPAAIRLSPSKASGGGVRCASSAAAPSTTMWAAAMHSPGKAAIQSCGRTSSAVWANGLALSAPARYTV